MTDYERQEAVFAEVVSLTHELNRAISTAERVQDVKLNAQNIERLEQRITQALRESNTTLQRAGWLSTKSFAMYAVAVFLVSGLVGVIGGTYIAREESEEFFAEQRAEKIARFSLEHEAASELINRLRELDVEIYTDALVWDEDSEAADAIKWATIDDPENEGKRIKIVKITDIN